MEKPRRRRNNPIPNVGEVLRRAGELAGGLFALSRPVEKDSNAPLVLYNGRPLTESQAAALIAFIHTPESLDPQLVKEDEYLLRQRVRLSQRMRNPSAEIGLSQVINVFDVLPLNFLAQFPSPVLRKARLVLEEYLGSYPHGDSSFYGLSDTITTTHARCLVVATIYTVYGAGNNNPLGIAGFVPLHVRQMKAFFRSMAEPITIDMTPNATEPLYLEDKRMPDKRS